MKKLLLIFFIAFCTRAVFGQDTKHPNAVITAAFSDSLKKEISKIIPRNYTIELSYRSEVSPQGKLIKPLITREEANGTIADNNFVQKLKALIQDAPAWEPAFDAALNKEVSGVALFYVSIKKGQILIGLSYDGRNKF